MNKKIHEILILLTSIPARRTEVKKFFYKVVKHKTMWNKVLNNYIKPIIKKIHPRYNSDVKLEIVI